MEDNEVELKDAKPGMWATFDVPERIDSSDFHAEPGHYEGVILEPTEDCVLGELIHSIMRGCDVTRLSVDSSVFGLEEGMPCGFAIIEDGERPDKCINKSFANVHVYKTKPDKNTEPESYEDIPRDKPGFYLDGNGNAWCVDKDGNAWSFTPDWRLCIEYKGSLTLYYGPFRKARLVAA